MQGKSYSQNWNFYEKPRENLLQLTQGLSKLTKNTMVLQPTDVCIPLLSNCKYVRPFVSAHVVLPPSASWFHWPCRWHNGLNSPTGKPLQSSKLDHQKIPQFVHQMNGGKKAMILRLPDYPETNSHFRP